MKIWNSLKYLLAGASETGKTVAMIGAVSVTAGVAGQVMLSYVPPEMPEMAAPAEPALRGERGAEENPQPPMFAHQAPAQRLSPSMSALPAAPKTAGNLPAAAAGEGSGDALPASASSQEVAVGSSSSPPVRTSNDLGQKQASANSSGRAPATSAGPAPTAGYQQPVVGGIGTATATATAITPPVIKLSAASSSVYEGSEAIFYVSLSAPVPQDVSVKYATSSDGAVGGTDFTSVSGTLIIPANSLYNAVSVATTSDNLDETSESFTFTISSPSFGTINTSQYSVTIVDADISSDFTSLSALPSTYDFERSSTALYYDESGTLQTASANSPRFDYDPSDCTNSVCTAKGLLIEPSRTNMALHSVSLNGAPWSGNAATISQGAATAPDSTTVVGSVVEDATTATHGVSSSAITATTTQGWTFSFYAKANGRTKVTGRLKSSGGGGGEVHAVFTLSGTGTVGTVAGDASTLGKQALITSVGNDWYRCVLSTSYLDASATDITLAVDMMDSTNATSYAGDNASGVYLWGMQLEQGDSATSYIPTVASTVTREADVLSLASLPTLSSGFTAIFDFTRDQYESTDSSQTPLLFSTCNSSSCTSDFTKLYFNAATNAFKGLTTEGASAGSTSSLANSTSLTVDDAMQVGFVRSATGANRVFVNGTAATEGSTSTSPSTSNFILGGGGSSSSSYENQLNGHLTKFTFRKRALTSTQVKALTSD